MPEVTLTISAPDEDSTVEELKGVLEEISEIEKQHLVNVNVEAARYTHDDWNQGDPCPCCGSEYFHVEEITYSYYVADGDQITYQERADGVGEQLAVMCDNPECTEQLYRSPASFLTDV